MAMVRMSSSGRSENGEDPGSGPAAEKLVVSLAVLSCPGCILYSERVWVKRRKGGRRKTENRVRGHPPSRARASRSPVALGAVEVGIIVGFLISSMLVSYETLA